MTITRHRVSRIADETHPQYLRTRLVTLWLDLADMPSVRAAGRALGVSQPSVTRWLSGENEPSRVHLGMMAGYCAEGAVGLTWASKPVERMAGYIARSGRVHIERVMRMAIAPPAPDEEVAKQVCWRLFELCLLSRSGYSFRSVVWIDWERRVTQQSERTPCSRRGLWMPPDPLHLACPAPVRPAAEPETQAPGSEPSQRGYRPYKPRGRLW